jgi:RNA polymerase sigma-70 factor (sigma-E family)
MQFEEYAAARGPALLRLAHVLTGNAHDAEDVVQSALADTYRHWRKVTRAGSPDAYVRRIVVNTHLAMRRRRSSTELPSGDRLNRGRSSPDLAEGVVDRDEMHRRLDELHPRARAVLVLRYYADLDDAEIADVMGIAPGSVRSMASRALAALRPSAPDPAHLHSPIGEVP